jgi:hypothetical protein
MVQKREAYAPWSLTRKAGVQSATVNGDIEVPQFIQPTLDTGFVDEKGDWKGRPSSDEQFFAFGKDEAIANGATILAPQIASGSIWPLDMTGFRDLQIAVRPSNGGNYALQAVMGPADLSYSNLKDVNPASLLRGITAGYETSSEYVYPLFSDGAESLTADVWNIFFIGDRLRSQKLLQFKITNNSGGESDIETAFLRLV